MSAAFVAAVSQVLSPWAGAQSPGQHAPFAQIIGSTYLGGSDSECAFDAATAPDGTIVIVGTTYSANLPVTSGAYDKTFSPAGTGLGDAFVAKVDPGNGMILACTYLGGSGGDEARRVAVDREGRVYCAGYTNSIDFPVTPGAFSTRKNGITDLYIARFDHSLSNLEAATFLGGSAGESGPAAIALHEGAASSLVLATRVESSDMPVTPGAFDVTLNGLGDIWIGALTLDLTTLKFGTFVGGNDAPIAGDEVSAMALDANGDIVFSGTNAAPDFPQTVAPWPTAKGSYNAYVARLASDGSQLLHSGFIGGSGLDWFSTIAIDTVGNVYLAGGTWSDDFPVTPGAYDTTPNTLFEDGILVCLAPDLRTLLRATFAGTATKSIQSMSIDSTGSPTYITATSSAGFIGSLGAWSQYAPILTGNNWIIARLDPDFRDLLHGTYLGGSEGEGTTLIRAAESGRIVVVGCTTSVDYPVTPSASQIASASGPSYADAVITLYSMLPQGLARFGSSTSGCTGEVVAGATQSASLGAGWFGLTCTGAPPSSKAGLLAISLFGLQPPVTAKGVSVWIDPAALVALLPVASGESGFSRIDLHLPAGASLLSLQVAGQFFWQDPCGPSGWTTSGALLIVVVE